MLKGKEIVWPGEQEKVEEIEKVAPQVVKPSKEAKKEVKKSSTHEKEFTFKIKPKPILKGAIIIAVVLLAFLVGRISAADDPFALSGLSTAFGSGENSVDLAAESEDTTEEVPEVEAQAAPTEPETKEEAKEEAPVEEKKEEVVVKDTSNDPVITTYKNVKLTLVDKKIDWKGTWGKVTKIKVTIQNSEKGTVNPDHIIMMMEGYGEDVQKRIPLPPSMKTVKKGTSVQTELIVPSGFSYSPSVVGDLSGVGITLSLYDASDVAMHSINRQVSLAGSN